MKVLLPLLYLMFSLTSANDYGVTSGYKMMLNGATFEKNLLTNNKSLQFVRTLRPSEKNETSKIVVEDNNKKNVLTDNLKPASFVISPGARKRLLLNDKKIVWTSQQYLDDAEISSGFGKRTDPINKRQKFHKGIDISRPMGTEVFAWEDGVVTRSGWLGGYGLTVDIVHPNGIKTRYAHLKRAKIREGQKTIKGQIVGLVGETGRTTGANLHFEVVVAGKLEDPARHLSEDTEIVGDRPNTTNKG